MPTTARHRHRRPTPRPGTGRRRALVATVVLLLMLPLAGFARADTPDGPPTAADTTATMPADTADSSPSMTGSGPVGDSPTPAATPSSTSPTPTPSSSAAPTSTTPPATTGTADAGTPTGTVAAGPPSTTAAATVPATSPRPDPRQLRIMNYYPADAAWTAMWTSYSHARTDADFADIASLDATTVRIIVQPQGVGWPTVTAAGAATLRDMIDTAADHGLTVELTLFDLWYSWNDVAASKTWVTQLLAGYRDDPRIVLVELENEMSFTHQPAVSWAQEMLPYLATVLPGVPRSLSTNTIAAVRALGAAIPTSSLEVIDIHLYGDLGIMPQFVAAARAVAGGRPVIVGEAGRSTAEATAGSEQGQLTFYQAVAQLTRDSGIGVFAPWTLTDFVLSTVPAAFRTASEATFGLRRLDGSWKPAAGFVRDMFGGTAGPGPDPQRLAAAALDADRDFEHTDAAPSTAGRLSAWRVFDAADTGFTGAAAGAGTPGAAVLLARTGGSPSMVPAICQTFLLLSGKRSVTAAVDVKLVSATGFSRLAVAWFDGSTYLGSTESANAVNTATGWQHLTATGTAPAAATSFQIHLKSAYNSGSAWFDNVTLA